MDKSLEKRVLILDDDIQLAKALELEFRDHGYQPFLCETISSIPETHLDYAVVDMRLTGEFGITAIEKIKSRSPNCKIVILSGYGSVATAVEAVKRGAVNYLMKPVSFSHLEAALLGKEVDQPGLKTPSLSQMENEYIDYVLMKNDGNISKSAKDLGIHRQSLQRKLKKYF